METVISKYVIGNIVNEDKKGRICIKLLMTEVVQKKNIVTWTFTDVV
jgi:hypothetical protein